MLLVADINQSIRRQMTKEEKQLFGIDRLNVKRSSIPAVTHVDYSARIQTVHKETNPKYYKLIDNFKKITNCPILVNTSFNIGIFLITTFLFVSIVDAKIGSVAFFEPEIAIVPNIFLPPLISNFCI